MAHRARGGRTQKRNGQQKGQRRDPVERALAAQKEAIEGAKLTLAVKHHLFEHGENLASVLVDETPAQQFLKFSAFGLGCVHSDFEKKAITSGAVIGKLGSAVADSLTQREVVDLLGPCSPGERGAGPLVEAYSSRLEEGRGGMRHLRELNASPGKETGDYSEALCEGKITPMEVLEMSMHLALDSRDPQRLWGMLGDKASDELAKFIIKFYANAMKALGLGRIERRLLNMGVSRLYPDEYNRVKESMWEKRLARQIAKSVLENLLHREMKRIGGNALLKATEITSRIKWDARGAIKIVEKDEFDWDTVGVRAEICMPAGKVHGIANKMRKGLFEMCSAGTNKINNSTFWITSWDDHYADRGTSASGIHINFVIHTPEGNIGGEMQIRDAENGKEMREGEAADAHYQSRCPNVNGNGNGYNYALTQNAFKAIKEFRGNVAATESKNPLRNFKRHFLTVDHGINGETKRERLSILLEQGAKVVDAVQGTFGVEKAVMANGNGLSLHDDCPAKLHLKMLEEPREMSPHELRRLAESAREQTNKVSLLELSKKRVDSRFRGRR